MVIFGGSTSNDEMNSVDENDKNESDVNPDQLVPVSNCHLQNSTACMHLKPRTESVTSSSNMMSLASRKDTNPFSLYLGANISGGVINLNIYSGKRKHYREDSSQEWMTFEIQNELKSQKLLLVQV